MRQFQQLPPVRVSPCYSMPITNTNLKLICTTEAQPSTHTTVSQMILCLLFEWARKGTCGKLNKMTVAETDELPYLLPLAEGYPYMITSNIDIADGLVNGAFGVLRHIERQQSNVDDHYAVAGPSTSKTLPASREEIITLWFGFPEAATGAGAKIKCRPHVQSKPNTLSPKWVPMYKKVVKISLTKTVKCKRKQFPCVPACPINHSQVTRWDVWCQQLVYVAMSRVTNIDGLHIVIDKDAFFIFEHGRDGNDSQITRDIT